MSELIRAVIVDDEAPGRDNLRLALARYPNWKVVAECDSAPAASMVMAGGVADVVFIDVQMPGESGLSLARSLCDLPRPPMMVFVTAHSRFAIQAFDVHAVDYVLKPVDDSRLNGAVQHVESLLGMRSRSEYAASVRASIDDASAGLAGASLGQLEKLCIRSVGKMETVRLSDVNWLASAGNYVELHLTGRSVLYRSALSKLEPRLDPAVFVRVHRTVIVRRDKLVSLSVVSAAVYVAQLSCGATVPVSPRHVDEVRSLLS